MTFDPRVTWGQIIPAKQPVQGKNERCIELPLAAEVLRQTPHGAWILDAGASLNRPFDGSYWPIVHLTQSLQAEPLHKDWWRSYVQADLRNLSIFADGAFETTLCISTLEHIGMDNSGYGGRIENDPRSAWRAVYELARVTARTLFVTVPFGSGGNEKFRPWQEADVWALLEASFSVRRRVGYYAKCEAGWYGGGSEPLTPQAEGKVTQIACIRIDKA